jgi:hypothetical protein
VRYLCGSITPRVVVFYPDVPGPQPDARKRNPLFGRSGKYTGWLVGISDRGLRMKWVRKEPPGENPKEKKFFS